MWEKAAYIAFFVELCLAQRGAIGDLNARQAGDSDLLVARAPQANVFTTVLFPSVPTAAPTGVAVPTIITYTGTFDTSIIPPGYVFDAPATTGHTVAATTATQATTATTQTHTTASTTPRPSRSADTTSRSMSSIAHSSSESSRSLSQSNSFSKTMSSSSKPHTSSASSTSHASTSSTSSSSSSTPTGSSHNNTNAAALNDKNALHLSGGAIGGIVGGVVGGIALLAVLMIFLLNRRKKEKVPDSPGIYPQEAYLYDPPVTPPGATALGGPQNFDIPRSGTPEMTSNENSGLLAGEGAAGALAVGAAARNRRGNETPEQRPGFSGYAPVDDGDSHPSDPFNDPSNEYRRSVGAAGAWPQNPSAPSGLGTPPGSSAGPSGTQTPRSYRDIPPISLTPDVAPQIAGVGSQKYERRISGGPTGNLAPGSYNPAMQQARRAWGMDEP